MQNLNEVLAHIDTTIDQSIERLFDLLRIESISTDPAYRQPCIDAANWLCNDLASFGVNAARRDTPGLPMVVGHGGPEQSERHFLFYGHYDVQPVDPLELWHRPPFDPAIEDSDNGKIIRARGAADDKGQLMTFVEACRAWVAVHGQLPCHITFLFEGEEESGSPSLVPFLEQHKAELSAQLALVCDTGMWDSQTPAISTMLRGMVGEEVTLYGADKDLHSGMYGGPAQNPIRVLSRLLAGLHDENGRVTLPGFYDGVSELPSELAQQWRSLNFSAEKFLAEVDLSQPAGERDYPALQQIWSRPTCEFNGINGGYTGDGFKTVLPAQASAKISFRLVGAQDPQAIRQSLRDYINANLPTDCRAEFSEHGGAAATVMPTHEPVFAQAREALSAEWPNPAVFIGCGGSIPVVGHFRDILEMNSLMIGFGLEDDQIHSPNEKYQLASYHKGIRSWARVLAQLPD